MYMAEKRGFHCEVISVDILETLERAMLTVKVAVLFI